MEIIPQREHGINTAWAGPVHCNCHLPLMVVMIAEMYDLTTDSSEKNKKLKWGYSEGPIGYDTGDHPCHGPFTRSER